jgi:hypothetical protein
VRLVLAEDLYEDPRADISQGDILEKLPSAHLVRPLQALFARPDGSMAVESEDHPDFNDKKGQPVVASCKRARALLLSYDCEIDKPAVKHWIIAPIVPLSLIPGPSHSDAKKNKIFSLLYLPSYRDILEESVLVLNHITTLDREFVQRTRRILSLSDIGRRALYAQYVRWLTRWQLSEIRCPNCNVSFNASDGMTVRPD